MKKQIKNYLRNIYFVLPLFTKYRRVKNYFFRNLRPSLHNVKNPVTFFYYVRYLVKYNKSFKDLNLYSNIKYARKPRRILCTLPRSGSGYIARVYQSVLLLKDGSSEKIVFKNGFQDVIDINWFPSELNNYVASIGRINGLHNINLFHRYAITISHHPIQNADLININHPDVTPCFTMRNIFDSLRSWIFYWHIPSDEWYGDKDVGLEYWYVIKYRLNDIIYHYNYWGRYIENKIYAKDYLCVKYEELLINPLSEFKKIFNFYEINVNTELLSSAISENTYSQTVKKVLIADEKPEDFNGISIKPKRKFSDVLNNKIATVINDKLQYDFDYDYFKK